MTRIIAGVARGRRLVVPSGGGTRPTSDRAREGLFNSLGSWVDMAGSRVADLFAGSGAVGLEALSRGADHVLLVERHPKAVQALRTNVDAVGIPGAQIVCSPVERVMDTTPGHPYDVIFLDPPYAFADAALTALLERVADGAWLATEGVCVVERSRRTGAPRWPSTMVGVRERGYGEGVLWYGSRS